MKDTKTIFVLECRKDGLSAWIRFSSAGSKKELEPAFFQDWSGSIMRQWRIRKETVVSETVVVRHL